MTLRVALIQTRTPDAPGKALEEAAPIIQQAAREGAQFILTPEGSNFLQRRREAFETTVTDEARDPFVQGARALAREHQVWLLIGSALVRRADGLCANRSMLVGPDGEVTATYDKIHMFDVDLPTGERHRESALYAPGDRAVVAQGPGCRIGMSVCYDLRFPSLYRAMAQAGAQVMTIPAAFTRPTGEAHWEVLMRARAIENGAFVLAPAQGGQHADGRVTWGRSMVVGPWGEVIVAATDDEPGIVFADLDLSLVEKARAAIPSLVNGRAFTGP